MSTSILYHCFGITGRGYHHVHMRFERGRTIFRIDQDPTTFRCARCGCRRIMKKGAVFRMFKGVPIGSRPTVIEFPIQRALCLACGVVRQVKIEFAEEDRRYTRQFERQVLELSGHKTIQDVAGHLGLRWNTVKDIQKRYLRRTFSRPKLRHLKLIAIDEITIGHGHCYLTVVLDFESGAVVFVGDGKDAQALEPFWRRPKASRAKIEALAMDMSNAYISAVTSRSFPCDQAVQ